MTTVDTLGATQATQTHHRPSPTQMKAVFSAVEQKLGMSSDDLKAALKSGKSLADIAKDKGVSADDLNATVKQALGSDATDATTSAIVNRKGGPHGHHHHGGPPPAAAGATSATDSGGVSFTLPQQSADGSKYV